MVDAYTSSAFGWTIYKTDQEASSAILFKFHITYELTIKSVFTREKSEYSMTYRLTVKSLCSLIQTCSFQRHGLAVQSRMSQMS